MEPIGDASPQVKSLHRCGVLLFGPQWQTALARALGPLHQQPRDSIDERLMRRWAAGQRPVPAWVWVALRVLLENRIRDLQSALEGLE